jgi:hypothetical protein
MKEKIFTIDELKQCVYSAFEAGKFPYEKQNKNDSFFNPPIDCFEAVKVEDGNNKLVLLPAERQYPFLFRGQKEDYIPCFPSLYRDNPTDVDIFIERMRFVQFCKLLDEHPVIKYFFVPNHFQVNYEGLAQHYGLKTSMLDFTSNLDIALFFAMCPYDKDNDRYKYIDNEGGIGVLYVITPALLADMFDTYGPIIFNGKVDVIGLQAFDRPGGQRGFAMYLDKEEDLQAWMYKFRYTQADSKAYLEKYEQGNKLWIKDVLVYKTKSIVAQVEFTYDIFKRTFDLYRPKGFSKTNLKKRISEKGVRILPKCSNPVCFNEREKRDIIEEWNNEKCEAMTSHIIHRTWRYTDDKKNDGDGKEYYLQDSLHQFRSLKMVTEIEILRLVQSAIAAPAGGVHRGIVPSKKNHKNTDTGWQKVPGRLVLEKGKCFLSANDWMIEQL